MHYSLNNLRHSLRHFFIGKAATAITAMLLLILLARWLPKEDYAVYVSLQAILVIVNYVTSFGVSQSLLRYLPELRVANNNLPMYRMVVRSLLTRSFAIGLGFLVVWALQPWLVRWFNLGQWGGWVTVYLLVGWLRLSGQFLGRIMETLLWQKQSQYSQAVGSFIRLVAVGLAAAYATVDIPTLFVIELASEALIVMLLALGYVRQWRADPRRKEGDPGWWHTHRERSRRYALWSYLSSLASVLAGSAPYRLVAARMLLPESVALYGFTSGLMDMLNRYTPTRLMQGTLRSVLVARYTASGNHDDLIAKLGLNFRVNALMLALLAALVLCASGPALIWLTKGKYGEADVMLAALIGVLVLDVLRAQLELLAEVVERNQWALAGNIVLGMGVIAAFFMTRIWGTWGLVLGAGMGEALAMAVMFAGLKSYGAGRILEGRIIVLVLALFLAGWVGRNIPVSGVAGFFLALAATFSMSGGLLLALPPFSKNERGTMLSMVAGKRGLAG